MDRPSAAEPARGDWQVLVVPESLDEVRRFRVGSRALLRWRLLAFLGVFTTLVSWVALAFAWPRSAAYDEVFAENVGLKRRLDAIDRKMAEVDRILLRLRLYDAQLDSFAEPTGDHGPVSSSVDRSPPAEELWPDDPGELGGEEGGFRGAVDWVTAVDDRLTSFLDTFHRAEPHLSRVVEDLEQVRALRAALPAVWPADGLLTSDYGWRRSPWDGRTWTHHSGVDIGGVKGNVVRASAAGRVVLAGWDQGYGKAVRIDHGFGIETLYAHNSSLMVAVGDRVQAGQQIARMGSTGRSTGPHCHFELSIDGHVVDPLDYLIVPDEALLPGQRRPQ
ncbi:MAG: M23 family metallopeptidase [Alphaproteobacteria bacterium]|nr:M23 family metallopeptidase [Alphaproteobacteria bacterium]